MGKNRNEILILKNSADREKVICEGGGCLKVSSGGGPSFFFIDGDGRALPVLYGIRY